ncbi:sugar phosphate isomerase/epimerase family protein [Serratia fonticola]|uniref:sugar phosphate isomerase/epimerase family protein n=1 Tax=Serratia fonticola TaxID=47917 RepID=UPI00192CF3AD|nr:sugar phosphate isomerase/epimerase family protein [Serratia fonticola]MBL5825694.1 sugar phosphate isomerase/epimerase [Serratia fonticola]
MKISCSNVMLPGTSLTEKAQLLRQWGYDGIALFVSYKEWSDDLHEEILTLKEKTGVTPCEFAFADDIYGHLMSEDPELRAKSRKMYKLAAQVSGEIGAVTELEFAYGAQTPLPLFHPYKAMSAVEESAFIDMYQEVTEPLFGTEGKMLLEGINRYECPYLNSIKQCKDLTDKLTFENAGVLADFFHMSIEEANIAESIRYAGDSIKHVHLGDNNRLLPGHGSIDWQGSFDALKDIGYHGFLNLECSTCGDPTKTLPETASFLRKLLK